MLSLPLAIRSALVVSAGKPPVGAQGRYVLWSCSQGTPVCLHLCVPPLWLPALLFLPVLWLRLFDPVGPCLMRRGQQMSNLVLLNPGCDIYMWMVPLDLVST